VDKIVYSAILAKHSCQVSGDWVSICPWYPSPKNLDKKTSGRKKRGSILNTKLYFLFVSLFSFCLVIAEKSKKAFFALLFFLILLVYPQFSN